MESALSSVDAAAAGDEAGGHAVDYASLPNAIVPVMSELFKAPLSKEEEYYALEVCSVFACLPVCVHLRPSGVVLRSAVELCDAGLQACSVPDTDGLVVSSFGRTVELCTVWRKLVVHFFFECVAVPLASSFVLPRGHHFTYINVNSMSGLFRFLGRRALLHSNIDGTVNYAAVLT